MGNSPIVTPNFMVWPTQDQPLDWEFSALTTRPLLLLCYYNEGPGLAQLYTPSLLSGTELLAQLAAITIDASQYIVPFTVPPVSHGYSLDNSFTWIRSQNTMLAIEQELTSTLKATSTNQKNHFNRWTFVIIAKNREQTFSCLSPT